MSQEQDKKLTYQEQREARQKIAKILGIDESEINYVSRNHISGKKDRVGYFCIGNVINEININREINFKELSNYHLAFKNCTFKKEVNFNEAIFEKIMDFSRVTFKKEVNFSEATFANEMNFREITFANKINFKKTTFKKNIRFEQTIFKEIIDFSRATFEGIINFYRTAFEKEVNFTETIFKEEVNFTETIFKTIISFSKITFFNEITHLRGDILFKEIIDFSETVFEKEVNFKEATFEKEVNFKEAVFEKCINFSGAKFKEEIYFSGAKFKESVDFTNANFENYADFHQSEFEKAACFYGVNFKQVPNFSQAIFKGSLNLVNAKLNFDFENLEIKIQEECKKYNKKFTSEQEKKPLENFANDFRDSFRLFKSALIKENNLLDASNFHRVELYCKEIELENKQEKSLKDKVDKWVLKLYRLISDHHTDLLRSWHTLLILIGIFGLLSYVSIIVFNFCFLGFWDCNPYNSIKIYNIHTKHSLLDNYKLLGINFSILVAFTALFLCSMLKWIRYVAISFSYIITTLILISYPKYLVPAIGMFGDKRMVLDPLSIVGGIYMILFGFIFYSFIKTARKNSIVPS